jgi:Sec7-like guanine-nucleotide exchange factor
MIETIECAYNDINDKKSQDKILGNLFNEKRKKKYKKIILKGNEMNQKVIDKYKEKIKELVDEFIDVSDEEEEGRKYEFNEKDHGGK